MSIHTPHDPELENFLAGKSEQARSLLNQFIARFETIGNIGIHPAKTMIGISNGHKRVAWVTQLGESFVHIVFPFEKPYDNNLCFQKIAQVPGDDKQFNHHFRMLHPEDLNEEVMAFMKLAWQEEKA